MSPGLHFQFINKEQTHISKYQSIWKYHYKMPNGKPKAFEIHELGGTAVILPLTPDNQVITVSQYRPGPNKVLTALPAGFVDPGETPLQAAQRELLEETGYSGQITYIGDSYVDAYSTAIRHIFIARNCHPVAKQNLDSSEFIEVKLMSIEALRQICLSGRITHGESVFIALENI